MLVMEAPTVDPLSLLEVCLGDDSTGPGHEPNSAEDVIEIQSDDEVHNAPMLAGALTQGDPERVEVQVDVTSFLDSTPEYSNYLSDDYVNDSQNGLPGASIKKNVILMNKVLASVQKLSSVDLAEQRVRCDLYRDVKEVQKARLHCTICDVHIGCQKSYFNLLLLHPLLKVLVCSKCCTQYSYVAFPLSNKGKDIRCRWCARPGTRENHLRTCSRCPFSFCQECMHRNFLGEDDSARSRWVCCVCNLKKLYPSRALAWAFISLLRILNSDPELNPSIDVSSCCQSKKVNEKNKPPVTNGRRHTLDGGPSRTNATQLIETKLFKNALGSLSATALDLVTILNDLKESIPSKVSKEGFEDKLERLGVIISENTENIKASYLKIHNEFSGSSCPPPLPLRRKAPLTNSIQPRKKKAAPTTPSANVSSQDRTEHPIKDCSVVIKRLPSSQLDLYSQT